MITAPQSVWSPPASVATTLRGCGVRCFPTPVAQTRPWCNGEGRPYRLSTSPVAVRCRAVLNPVECRRSGVHQQPVSRPRACRSQSWALQAEPRNAALKPPWPVLAATSLRIRPISRTVVRRGALFRFSRRKAVSAHQTEPAPRASVRKSRVPSLSMCMGSPFPP